MCPAANIPARRWWMAGREAQEVFWAGQADADHDGTRFQTIITTVLPYPRSSLVADITRAIAMQLAPHHSIFSVEGHPRATKKNSRHAQEGHQITTSSNAPCFDIGRQTNSAGMRSEAPVHLRHQGHIHVNLLASIKSVRLNARDQMNELVQT